VPFASDVQPITSEAEIRGGLGLGGEGGPNKYCFPLSSNDFYHKSFTTSGGTQISTYFSLTFRGSKY